MFTPYILIPSIVGIICAIIGYVIGKSKNPQTDGENPSSLKADLDACRSNAKNLSAKLEKLEHGMYELEHGAKATSKISSPSPSAAKASQPEAKSPKPSSGNSFDKVAAKAALGKKHKKMI